MRRKSSKDVTDLVRNLGSDPAFLEDLQDHLDARRLVRRLVALRGAKGFTQREIAEKVGLSQSWVSKFEASRDADVSFDAVERYARAIGYQLEVSLLHDDPGQAERILIAAARPA
jgi:predicted XRE-type DNA-binding protein